MKYMLNVLELSDYNKLSTEAREYLIRSKDENFVKRLNLALKFALNRTNSIEE